MVARQMREQRCVNAPDESWTQEQVDMFELQRKSKATFKVFVHKLILISIFFNFSQRL